MSNSTKIVECAMPDGSVVYTNLGCSGFTNSSPSIVEIDSVNKDQQTYVANDYGWGGLSLSLLIPCIYIGMSIVSFLLYWQDKNRAIEKLWRIPENTMHLFDLLGGWIGGFLGQKIFRHKTRKIKYRIIYWMTVVANIVIFVDWHNGFPLLLRIKLLWLIARSFYC